MIHAHTIGQNHGGCAAVERYNVAAHAYRRRELHAGGFGCDQARAAGPNANIRGHHPPGTALVNPNHIGFDRANFAARQVHNFGVEVDRCVLPLFGVAHGIRLTNEKRGPRRRGSDDAHR
jgi:hypothetical protein